MGKEDDYVRSQVDGATSDIADEFASAMAWLRGQHSLAEIAAAIESHKLDAILTSDDLKEAAQRIARAVNTAYGDAAQEIADQIDDEFDFANRWAVSRIQQNDLRLVRDLTHEQRETIRDALADATEQGMNPRQAATMIRDAIGLTPTQQDAVANYRQSLVDGSMRALDYELRDRRYDGVVSRGDLTEGQIATMTSRYQDRLLNYRSEVVARTEALRAVHQGAADMWKQATTDGTVDASTVIQTWRTSHDGRVRASHRAMDKQERKLGEPFETNDGVQLLYPGDPDAPPDETVQCRCVVVTRIRR